MYLILGLLCKRIGYGYGQAYFARMEEVNLHGPALRAIIEVNPSAMEQAASLDSERQVNGTRGPLHGIPILLKDNIATRASDGMLFLVSVT